MIYRFISSIPGFMIYSIFHCYIALKTGLRHALNHDSEPDQLLSLARNYKRFNIFDKEAKRPYFF